MDNENIYKKWKEMTFLDGLDEETAKALSIKYEELERYLKDHPEIYENDKIRATAFPTLRYAYSHSLAENYSPEALCNKIIGEYDVEADKIKDKVMHNIFMEMELASLFGAYFSNDKEENTVI